MVGLSESLSDSPSSAPSAFSDTEPTDIVIAVTIGLAAVVAVVLNDVGVVGGVATVVASVATVAVTAVVTMVMAVVYVTPALVLDAVESVFATESKDLN